MLLVLHFCINSFNFSICSLNDSLIVTSSFLFFSIVIICSSFFILFILIFSKLFDSLLVSKAISEILPELSPSKLSLLPKLLLCVFLGLLPLLLLLPREFSLCLDLISLVLNSSSISLTKSLFSKSFIFLLKIITWIDFNIFFKRLSFVVRFLK